MTSMFVIISGGLFLCKHFLHFVMYVGVQTVQIIEIFTIYSSVDGHLWWGQ